MTRAPVVPARLVILALLWAGGLSAPQCAKDDEISLTECGALASVWMSTGGTLPWHGSDFCGEWKGVTCQNGRVYKLNLHDRSLTGKLPSALGALSELHYLSLSQNAFEGALPAELGALSKLVAMNVEANALTGPLPPELGALTNLKYLILRNNDFTGEVPDSFTHMTHINQLAIEGNPNLRMHAGPAPHVIAAQKPVSERPPVRIHRIHHGPRRSQRPGIGDSNPMEGGRLIEPRSVP